MDYRTNIITLKGANFFLVLDSYCCNLFSKMLLVYDTSVIYTVYPFYHYFTSNFDRFGVFCFSFISFIF